jgi:hypothetical protein
MIIVKNQKCNKPAKKEEPVVRWPDLKSTLEDKLKKIDPVIPFKFSDQNTSYQQT